MLYWCDGERQVRRGASSHTALTYDHGSGRCHGAPFSPNSIGEEAQYQLPEDDTADLRVGDGFRQLNRARLVGLPAVLVLDFPQRCATGLRNQGRTVAGRRLRGLSHMKARGSHRQTLNRTPLTNHHKGPHKGFKGIYKLHDWNSSAFAYRNSSAFATALTAVRLNHQEPLSRVRLTRKVPDSEYEVGLAELREKNDKRA